ncbi:hypothetical protein ACHHYP_06017 [Achlya hypogyna]|uniref:Uncharacterized protein n=1 Tax=Achlya hypogyna TaxID=1202772 RepID=A0A1V9ZNF9_ACHHY|nr:hypothetical protein ACHHYP_06017 [Achlya hypogyna]
MNAAACYWNETRGSCYKADWKACGYAWLNVAPVGLFAAVWVGFGITLLRHHGFLLGLFQVDASSIHDRIAQGIAIALSQRKFGSVRQRQLQRYLKLCAMCSEWPTYTFTPLSIAFKVSGTPPIIDSLLFSLNFTNERWNLGLAVSAGVTIAFLRRWHPPSGFSSFPHY